MVQTFSRWAAEGLSYLTLDADVKEKLVEGEPAMKALIELGKTGAQNVMYGVMATLVNVTNSYDKQEINPEMLELAKFAKHHIPEEHELDDEDFADKRICTIASLGVTSALVALAKTESLNMRELIGRVMNAICKHAELRGLVVQQGGSKALIPLALEGTDKGRVVAAQVFMIFTSYIGLLFINFLTVFNSRHFQGLGSRRTQALRSLDRGVAMW